MQHFYNPNCNHHEKYLIYAKVQWEPETEGQPIKQYCKKCLNSGFNALKESVFFWLNRRCGISKDICTMITNSSKYFPKPWNFVLTFDEDTITRQISPPFSKPLPNITAIVINESYITMPGEIYTNLVAHLEKYKRLLKLAFPNLKQLQLRYGYMSDRYGVDLLNLIEILQPEKLCVYDSDSLMFYEDEKVWTGNVFYYMPEHAVYTFVLDQENNKKTVFACGNKKIYVF